MPLKVTQPTSNRFCKGLFFAPGGAGKTVLMGTAALDERTSPCLLIDFEGGFESLVGLDIDIAEVRSWNDYNEAYEILADPKTPYKSCGIDSISETHKFALLDILRTEGPNRKDPMLLEQRDYGKATIQMRRLLRHFRDLPMHVFFSAHAKEIEIPREGRVRVPDMAGQMAEEVAGLMSVVGYLAQFEEENVLHRTLLLHSFPKYRIKARTPWGTLAPEEIIDPTITSLLDALGYTEGEVGRVATPVHTISSRDKELIEKEVPVDIDKTEEEVQSPPTPVEVQQETPPSEETLPVEPDSTPESEPDVPQDEEHTLLPYDQMTIKDLKKEASERDIEYAGVTTKQGIIELLRAQDELEQQTVNA